MRNRMSQLILLIVSVFQIDEDAEVMCSWCDSYTGACEFGAYLIKTAGADTLHGAINEKGGYRRMMRSLLSDVRYSDLLVLGIDMMRSGLFVRLTKYWRCVVFDLPVTLNIRSLGATIYAREASHTRKNSPRVELYGLHGFPLTYF